MLMVQKIKNFFLFLLKRRVNYFLFFFVLLVILFVPRPALAAWYDFLIGAITFIPNVFLALIVYIVVVLTALFAGFAGLILNWVISPNFIALSYTRPGYNIAAGENPVIAIGLGITQGFVNMLLVLILVYIALATILRLAGYQTQKLLVTFVIVALLVNFSPLICGLIVDATNIIMHFFLRELTGVANLVNSLKSIKDVAIAGWDWTTFKVTRQIELVMSLVALAVFNLFSALALLLFASIFMLRYIAIWILVILSPLAFACYILPATKRFFDMWWHQFIQWSIVGITAGFFLYLGEQIVSFAPTMYGTPPPGAFPLGAAILPYLVPLAFLYIGLIVGLQSAAFGATAAISLTKKAGKKAGKWTGGAARGIPAVSRAEEKIRRRLETTLGISRLVGGPGAFEREKKAAVGAAAKRMDLIPDTPQGNQALLQRTTRPAITQQERYERAAAIELLAKRKALKFDQDPAKDAAIAQRFLPEAQRYGADVSAIYKARPDFAPHLTKIDPVTGKPVPMTIKEAMDKITSGDFWKNVQKDAFKDKRVAYLTARDSGKGGKFELLGRRASKSTKKEFKDALKKLYTDPKTPASVKKSIDASYKQFSLDPNWQI